MYTPARRHVARLGILLAGLVAGLLVAPVGTAPAAAAIPAAGAILAAQPAGAAAPAPFAAAAGGGAGGFGAAVALGTGRQGTRDILTADGIGPYRIGVSTRTGLLAAGLITGVTEEQVCNGFYAAEATGRYAGRLFFRFQGERLVLVSTTDPRIWTWAGGRVGMTLDELEQRYGPRGAIEYGKWTLRAYVVPSGDRIVAFFEDPYTPYVYRLASGERNRVLASFVGGDDQC